MEFITCPTSGCGFHLTREHMKTLDRWGPQLIVVEAVCPRCDSYWGPIALPMSVWQSLPLGGDTDEGREAEEPITADEVLEFYEYLQQIEGLPTPASLPSPEQIVRFVRSVVRESVSSDLLSDLRQWLEARWPRTSIQATLDMFLYEATTVIEHQAERLGRTSRLRELLSLFGMDPVPERQEFRENVHYQLRTLFLFGLLLGLGLGGELDDFIGRWQEEREKRRNI